MRIFLNGRQADSFIDRISKAVVREKFEANSNGQVTSPNGPEPPKKRPFDPAEAQGSGAAGMRFGQFTFNEPFTSGGFPAKPLEI